MQILNDLSRDMRDALARGDDIRAAVLLLRIRALRDALNKVTR